MKITLYTDDLREAPVDLMSVGVFSDEPDRGLAFGHLNRALDGTLEQACRDEEFKGREGQTIVFNVAQGLKAKRVLVYGYGERRTYNSESARRFAGTAAKISKMVNASSTALVLTVRQVPAPEGWLLDLVQALSEGVMIGSYAFNSYLTKEPKSSRLKDVRIAFAAEDVQGVKGSMLREAIAKGQTLSEAVSLARDLVNEPANILTPSAFAERAKQVAKQNELDVKILGPKEMEKQGMGLLLGVARGSEEEPRLIHCTYSPQNSPKKKLPAVALVGKGLTFDAGGLSLKTSDDMVSMKADMGGGAAVLAAMQAIAKLKPACTVHGIIAAVENMPDGRAIRPSDVLKSKKGLTVEVINTDAEGRLALADAIAYALELKPTDLIDVATLTGACMVALGRFTAGAFISDVSMAKMLKAAWKKTGERFWRLPLDQELRELLKSEVADLRNLGERYGGAITAALFLREFVEPEMSRWAHFDIAGPVMSNRESGYSTKGASGFGVRTLVEYVLLRAQESAA